MNLRELAFQLSAITLIADAAKEAKDRLRRQFAQALEEVGADSAKAALEGEEIAKVSLIRPKNTPQVLNEKPLLIGLNLTMNLKSSNQLESHLESM